MTDEWKETIEIKTIIVNDKNSIKLYAHMWPNVNK